MLSSRDTVLGKTKAKTKATTKKKRKSKAEFLKGKTITEIVKSSDGSLISRKVVIGG
jgi:hypothetical protein